MTIKWVGFEQKEIQRVLEVFEWYCAASGKSNLADVAIYNKIRKVKERKE